MRLRENMKAAKEHRCMKATCGEMRVSARRSRCNGAPFTYTPVGRGKNKRYYRRIFMPDLPLFFRLARPARSLPLLALFAFAGFAAPAAAEDAALPYDPPTSADTVLTRSEEHTSELQSLMRTSYAVSCLK